MVCSVAGCINNSVAKKLCQMHWRQMKDHGKITNVRSQFHILVDKKQDTAFCKRCGIVIDTVLLGGEQTCKVSARARVVRNNIKDYTIPDSIFINERSVCDICGSKQVGNKTNLCYDHDHTTGKFRGWLCNNCNYMLGHAKDNPEILAKAILYLTQNT